MGQWNVKIKDFQSLKSVDINIPAGITIITGPTNNGKTAILRAIENSLFNSMTDDMVRSGKKIAGVTISNQDHTMVYMRNSHGKSEKTAYQFDGGNVQKKVGRSQLPEVVQMFGVTDVKMQNGVKVRLNFWEQNDKPFLMDKTSGQLFEFLSLSSADRYFKILKSMAADIKVQEAEINNSNTVIDTLKSINSSKQDFLDKNKGFDEVYSDVIVLGQEVDKLNKNLSTVELLNRLQEQMDKVSRLLVDVESKYSNIPISVITEQVIDLDKKNSFYNKTYQSAFNLATTKKSIKSVESSLAESSNRCLELDNKISEMLSGINRLNILYSEVLNLNNKITSCESVLKSVEDISFRIGSIITYDIDFEKVYSDVEVAKSLKSNLEKMVKGINSLKTIEQSISGINRQVSEVDNKLNLVHNELESFKSEVGYCPFCGSVFDK